MKSYEKVQKWLDDNGITQRELADQVGMTEVAMSRFLQGKRAPRAPMLINIARVMGIDIHELINDDAEEYGVTAHETDSQKGDKITLKDALEIPVWKMIWAGEPGRMVDVRMTYSDLKVICDLIEGARKDEE